MNVVTTIVDFSEIDDGAVRSAHHSPHLADRSIKRDAEQPRGLHIRRRDRQGLTCRGDPQPLQRCEDRQRQLAAKTVSRATEDSVIDVDGYDAVTFAVARMHAP